MKQTKDIIKQMEKKARRTEDKMDYEDYYEILVDDLRTLLESFGEEIINRLEEDVKVVIESEVVKEGNVINECISGVFGNERLKVKEILQNIT